MFDNVDIAKQSRGQLSFYIAKIIPLMPVVALVFFITAGIIYLITNALNQIDYLSNTTNLLGRLNNRFFTPIIIIAPTIFSCVGFSNISYKIINKQLFSNRDFFDMDNLRQVVFATTWTTLVIYASWRIWVDYYNPPYTVLGTAFIINNFLISLPIFLAAFLFFIQRYVMLNFILLDDPTLSWLEAIEYSKLITHGKRGQLAFFTVKQWLCLVAIACTNGVILLVLLPYLSLCYGNIYHLLNRDYLLKITAYTPPEDIFANRADIFGDGISTVEENLDPHNDDF